MITHGAPAPPSKSGANHSLTISFLNEGLSGETMNQSTTNKAETTTTAAAGAEGVSGGKERGSSVGDASPAAAAAAATDRGANGAGTGVVLMSHRDAGEGTTNAAGRRTKELSDR